MTDTTLPAGDEQAVPGARLSPRDESRLFYASIARDLADGALKQVPVAPDPEPGDLLRAALELARRAESLVKCAVIAERERGTTWDQIGTAAGTTRQAAHERWHPDVRAWAATGRSALNQDNPADSLESAARLDRLYSHLVPEVTDAVSAGLDAVRFPGSREYEGALRTRSTALHAQLDTLREQARELRDEYQQLKGGENPGALVANLTATAACDEKVADVFRQLVTAEPSLAEEHLHEVERHEGYAKNSRDHAALYA
ncbi:hypothetical protein ACIQNV_37250 [Streptomyces hydrogenans]|uniref:hypothetical protein n=1 Tax=Streptomyces hydrogenans TaxID=1873719 RepID=UPI003812AE2C